jgi:hypothetical protein
MPVKALKVAGALLLTTLFIVLEVTMNRLGDYWEFSEALWPVLGTFAGLFCFYLFLLAICRKEETALALAVILGAIFFSYAKLLNNLSAGGALAVQFLLMGLISFLVVKYPDFRKNAFSAIVAMMAIFTFIYAVNIQQIYMKKRYDLSAMPPKKTLLDAKDIVAARRDPAVQPDIYFIVLDAYAADKTLRRLFEHDNRPFLDALRQKGFYIAQDSHSFYAQTMLSISSTLNLNYFQDDVVLPNTRLKDRRPAINYFMRPRLPVFLRDAGYDLEEITTAYQLDYSFDRRNLDVRAKTFRVRVWNELLNQTPVYQILTFLFGPQRDFANPFKQHYHDMERMIGDAHRIAQEKNDRPKFVYAHFLMPHPPFVFSRDGGFAHYANLVPFLYKDGCDHPLSHLYEGEWEKFYRHGYIENLEYANRAVLGIVDDILAHRGARPVAIFVQSDHGSRMKFDFDKLGTTDFDEAFSILNAVYFSDGDYDRLSQDLSPVNTLRIALDKYFGLELPLLENRQWYSTWSKPYDFLEISDRLEKPAAKDGGR